MTFGQITPGRAGLKHQDAVQDPPSSTRATPRGLFGNKGWGLIARFDGAIHSSEWKEAP